MSSVVDFIRTQSLAACAAYNRPPTVIRNQNCEAVMVSACRDIVAYFIILVDIEYNGGLEQPFSSCLAWRNQKTLLGFSAVC